MEQEDRIRLSVRENKIVLAGGMIVIGFSLFILVMGIRYPSAEGNHLVFAAGLFLMMLCGMMMCVAYFHRELTVEDMNIHYVNYIGKGKEFSLDDIGYCKLKLYGNKKEALIESLVLFDLLGDKLCKLEMNMRGARDFLQYLVDNQIKIEYPGAKREKRSVAEPLLWEKAVCREEIGRYAEEFYDKMRPVFMEWEKKYQRFDAQWEFGLSEYVQDDFTEDRDMWQWKSTVQEAGSDEVPEDYICVGEAYLKRDGEYVMDRKGHVVGLLIPYIRQAKSYQVGEKNRIRKMDEEQLKERLTDCLTQIARELPRHAYHTQNLTLAHVLKRTAGTCSGKMPEQI